MLTIKALKQMIQELDQEEEDFLQTIDIAKNNFKIKREMYNKRIEEIRADNEENS